MAQYYTRYASVDILLSIHALDRAQINKCKNKIPSCLVHISCPCYMTHQCLRSPIASSSNSFQEEITRTFITDQPMWLLLRKDFSYYHTTQIRQLQYTFPCRRVITLCYCCLRHAFLLHLAPSLTTMSLDT